MLWILRNPWIRVWTYGPVLFAGHSSMLWGLMPWILRDLWILQHLMLAMLSRRFRILGFVDHIWRYWIFW